MPTVECPRHGLRYDSATHPDGCLRCRRTGTWDDARRQTIVSDEPAKPLLPALLAVLLGTLAAAWTQVDDRVHPLHVPPFPGMTQSAAPESAQSVEGGERPRWILSGSAGADTAVYAGVVRGRDIDEAELDRWSANIRGSVALPGGEIEVTERRFIPLSLSLAAAAVRLQQVRPDGSRRTELHALVPAGRRALELVLSTGAFEFQHQRDFDNWVRAVEGVRRYERNVLLEGVGGLVLRTLLGVAVGLLLALALRKAAKALWKRF